MRNLEPPVSAGLNSLDGHAIRSLGTDDFQLVRPVLEAVPPLVFGVPKLEEGFRRFMDAMSRNPWAMPCVGYADGNVSTICFLSAPDMRNLNAYLVALFRDHASSASLLALYIRHVFWSVPLHRVYTHVPDVESGAAHAAALLATGFQREGALVGHVKVGDDVNDALVFGLLRQDFSAWCAAHEPRLGLP